MSDVTFTEWMAHLTSLADKVRVRWPDVEVVAREHTLGVEIRDAMSGSVDLRIDRSTDSMAPFVSVRSSSGLPAALSVAQALINDVQRVLDVLHYLNRACERYRVYAEGSCPCLFCGASGETRSGECDRCDGGFR